MKITLYKNCIFSRSYSEVCDCRIKDTNGKTALDRYLATLTKEVFEIDTVYSTNSGVLNIPINIPNSTSNIYEFNYAKIEFETITRYCFIDDIQFRNYVAIVSYSEDIWHSYIADISIRNSFLTNTRLLKYNGKEIIRHFLPVDYETKSELQIIRRISDTNAYTIIAQVQLTKPAQTGQRTERQCFTVSLGKYDDFTAYTAGHFDAVEHTLSYTKAIELCNLAVKLSAQQMRDDDDTKRFTGAWYYEITNFTVIPDNFTFYKTVGGQPVNTSALFTAQIQALDVDNDLPQQLLFAYEVTPTESVPLPIMNTYEITNDFTLIGVGTLSANYDVINDGNNFTITFRYYASEIDFKFIMEMQGKFIDITDNFVYDVPFTSLTGSELAQQRTAKALQITNGVVGIVGGVVKTATAVAGGQLGYTASMSALNSVASAQERTRQALSRTRSSRARSSYSERLARLSGLQTHYNTELGETGVRTATGIMSGTGSIVNGITEIIGATQPNYVSNNGTFATGNNALSILYGFVLKYLIPSNETQVNDFINNIGYDVKEMMNNEVFAPLNTQTNKYNVIKFANVNIYGKCPQSVIEELKSMLINGVKIWYDEASI